MEHYDPVKYEYSYGLDCYGQRSRYLSMFITPTKLSVYMGPWNFVITKETAEASSLVYRVPPHVLKWRDQLKELFQPCATFSEFHVLKNTVLMLLE